MVRRHKWILWVITLTVAALSSALAEGPAGLKRDKNAHISKGAGSPTYQILNINNLWTWLRADGQSNHSPTEDDGCYFPRGTRWVIYQDGVMWGGKAYVDAGHIVAAPTQLVRVGGQTYNVGTRPGRIIGTGASAVAANPADADVRIYRIRRDYTVMSEEELRRDASESMEKLITDVSAGDMDDIRAQYEKDWKEWPVAIGAPYIERNGQPGFQAPPDFGPGFNVDSLIGGNYDEPGLAGADPNSPADQVVWTVYNDLDPTASLGLYGSEPLGLEVQVTMWGYKRSDALGNIYFKKIKFINKGGVEVAAGTKGSFYIDSMYVAQWSDPDLGAFGDDLAGCDSTLSLGFVYNGNGIDSEYRKFGLQPPASGYDFLQGPMVPGEATDRAVFDLKIVEGKKNLPLTSFAYFSAGSGISDPPFTREGGLRWWKMFKGFVPDPSTSPDRFYPHPAGIPSSKFPLSGDPVTRRGFIDGLGTAESFAPGDRRIVLNSGPFTLAPGDTQEIVVGTVAGLGSDRLSSVAVMKFNDRFVQNTYNALFQVPKPPAAPNVNVAELNGKVILDWGSDLERVSETEERVNQPGNFKFEGYNVYQLPSRTSRLSEAVRIATFDLTEDPTVVLDEKFDLASGQILRLPVQFGTNSGVKRSLEFSRDYVRDIDKIYNGQPYYLAVTAYSVAADSGYLPVTLESDPQVLTVVPKSPFGLNFATESGDTLLVDHKSGRSDGAVRPIVIDPTASTGHTYQVKFDTAGVWTVYDVSDNNRVVYSDDNQSGDEDYAFIEGGIQLKVEGPLPGLKRNDPLGTEDSSQWGWNWVAGSRFLTWASADGLGFEGFRGAAGWASPNTVFGGGRSPISASNLKAVEIRFAPTTDNTGVFSTSDPNASLAYRYGRGFTAPPARPEFAPYIINTTGSGYLYQDFTVSAPLAVYDIDATPPRRLAVGFLENNQPGGDVNGRYWPPFFSNADNVAASGPREWLFIFDADYSTTPNAAFQRDPVSNPLPIMYFATWARRNDNPWPAGNVLALYPARPNTVNDVFEYTLPAPGRSAANDRASFDRAGVFPNPYYAFNPAETNRFVRFVTFNNLPPQVTVRIFNLAGHLVRTISKNSNDQFLQWDLNNEDNFPVASGMYIAHVEGTLPSDGSKVTKILKLAIIQEQEIPQVF